MRDVPRFLQRVGDFLAFFHIDSLSVRRIRRVGQKPSPQFIVEPWNGSSREHIAQMP